MEFWVRLKFLWVLIFTSWATAEQSCTAPKQGDYADTIQATSKYHKDTAVFYQQFKNCEDIIETCKGCNCEDFPRDFWKRTDCPCSLELKRIERYAVWIVLVAFKRRDSPCFPYAARIKRSYIIQRLIGSSKCSNTTHFKSVVEGLDRLSAKCKTYAKALGLIFVPSCEAPDKNLATTSHKSCSNVAVMCQGCFCEESPRDKWHTTSCPCAIEFEHTYQSVSDNIYQLIFGQLKDYYNTPEMSKQCGTSGMNDLLFILIDFRLKGSRDCSTNLQFKRLIEKHEQLTSETVTSLTPKCFEYTLRTSVAASRRYKDLYDELIKTSKTGPKTQASPIPHHDGDCFYNKDAPRCYGYSLHRSVNATRWYKTRYEELLLLNEDVANEKKKSEREEDLANSGCLRVVSLLWIMQVGLLAQIFWKI